MGPDSQAIEAAEFLVAFFLLLVGVNIRVICVPVTEDGPVETIEQPRTNVQVVPFPEWEYPPAGHAPMRPSQARVEADRIVGEILAAAGAP